MSLRNTSSLPIRVENAEKSFGRRRLWTDVSFEVGPGEMLSLAGPSGSGKTTLLNCLGLLETLDTGRIIYGDRDATYAGASARRTLYRDSIGFLFQNSGLVESWTVRDNVGIALGRRRMSGKLKRQTVEKALDQMGLGGKQDDLVHTLSGGEQQRVGLARLLLKKAEVILADEPTASLDSDNSDVVIGALRELANRGAAVIISTHDERVIDASDAVVQLEVVSRERGSHALVRWNPNGEARLAEASSSPPPMHFGSHVS